MLYYVVSGTLIDEPLATLTTSGAGSIRSCNVISLG